MRLLRKASLDRNDEQLRVNRALPTAIVFLIVVLVPVACTNGEEPAATTVPLHSGTTQGSTVDVVEVRCRLLRQYFDKYSDGSWGTARFDLRDVAPAGLEDEVFSLATYKESDDAVLQYARSNCHYDPNWLTTDVDSDLKALQPSPSWYSKVGATIKEDPDFIVSVAQRAGTNLTNDEAVDACNAIARTVVSEHGRDLAWIEVRDAEGRAVAARLAAMAECQAFPVVPQAGPQSAPYGGSIDFQSVGKVRIGMTAPEITQATGAPAKYRLSGLCVAIESSLPGVSILTDERGRAVHVYVYGLGLTADPDQRWPTPVVEAQGGIRLGSSRADVVKAFVDVQLPQQLLPGPQGESGALTHSTDLVLRSGPRDEDYSLHFRIREDVVEAITLGPHHMITAYENCA